MWASADETRHAPPNSRVEQTVSSFPILEQSQVAAAVSEPGLMRLDFWQQACAPRRALEPRLEHLAQRRSREFTGYRIDGDQVTTADFAVQSIPTLVLLRPRRIQ